MVDTRKAVALLAYLAVTGQEQSRETLAALLWPEADSDRARAALRRTLSSLNQALGGEWLIIRRAGVALDRRAGCWIDLDEFRARLAECRGHGHAPSEVCSGCLTPLAEAVALYRDEFLAGFSLRDSPAFDDWQLDQAESLRRDLAEALDRLSRGHAAQGDFERAIGDARRWLALDPLHEPAHRRLMLLSAWTGQRGAAIRQYRECLQILDRELGVRPLEETTRLYEAIKENRVPAHPGPLPPPAARQPDTPAGPRRGPARDAASRATRPARQAGETGGGGSADQPLVGRTREWLALGEAYAARDTDGYLVAIEGEAGIGKTYLAEAFAEFARGAGATVITARCYDGETNLTYGPFVEGLRTVLGEPAIAGRLAALPDHWLGEAARLLPELAGLRSGLPTPPPLGGPGAQSRFFEGIGQALGAALGGAPPGVVIFDDLHWADTASLDLLTFLARRLAGHPWLLIVAWRSELVPAGHRLRLLLAEAQRTGRATLLRLPRLSRPEVGELVRSAIGRASARPGSPAESPNRLDQLADRLYRETEGLPFFLAEYLAVIDPAGLPAGDFDWSLPGGARDLLHSRLTAIGETVWQLLSTAAAIGRSFDFDTLREASGRGVEETVAGLEELMIRGLVGEAVGTGGEMPAAVRRAPIYDFGHEKLRTVVYEALSLARRRLLHRRIAEAIAGRARASREIEAFGSLIAHHYQLAGQAGEAAEYFALAGRHALALFAHAEALAHFRSALALGSQEATELHELVGDLHTLLGEYSAALTAYDLAAGASPPAGLARLEHKIGRVYHRRGDWELAESHFQSALSRLEESGTSDQSVDQRARVFADWSLAAHRRGRSAQALDLARRALELAEAAGDPGALAQAHNILGILAGSRGDLDEARRHLERSLAVAETLGDPAARTAALNNLALVARTAGELERALACAEAALALCVAHGDRHREAALHNNLADLMHSAGRTDAAMSHLKQAATIFADITGEAGALQPEVWKLIEW